MGGKQNIRPSEPQADNVATKPKLDKRVCVRFDRATARKVKAMARRRNMTVSDYIRMALEQLWQQK